MYLDHGYSMLRSFIRVRVTAPTVPPMTRTFDMLQRAPESWLIDAFLLATGHPEAEDPSDCRDYDGDVRSVTFGPDPTIKIPGIASGCRIEVLKSRDHKVG